MGKIHWFKIAGAGGLIIFLAPTLVLAQRMAPSPMMREKLEDVRMQHRELQTELRDKQRMLQQETKDSRAMMHQEMRTIPIEERKTKLEELRTETMEKRFALLHRFCAKLFEFCLALLNRNGTHLLMHHRAAILGFLLKHSLLVA